MRLYECASIHDLEKFFISTRKPSLEVAPTTLATF